MSASEVFRALYVDEGMYHHIKAHLSLVCVEGTYVTMHCIYPFAEMAYIIGFSIGDGTFTYHLVALYNTGFGFFDEILRRAEKVADYFGVKKVDRLDAYSWRIDISGSALARAIVTPGELEMMR